MRIVIASTMAICALLFGADPARAVCTPCDFDGSGTVTQLDYAVFYKAIGSKMGDINFDHRVDYDSSGTITMLDWALFLKFCPFSGSK